MDSLPKGSNAGPRSEELVLYDEGPVQQSIFGGEIIRPGSRPYLASIGGKRRCGGSLISPHAVMTAAYCLIRPYTHEWHPPEYVEFHRHSFYNDTGVKRVYVHDRSQCGRDLVYHPNYTDLNIGYDYNVAIIFLPTAITDITPVKLNEDPDVPVSGAPLDASGWGTTDPNIPGLNLSGPHAVTLDYLTNEACTKNPYKWSNDSITDSMMCAFAKMKSLCLGDGGVSLL